MPDETEWYTLVCHAHFPLDICSGSLNLKGPQSEVHPGWHVHVWGVTKTCHMAE